MSSQQATLEETAVPYAIPTLGDETSRRMKHREWYWSVHDKDSYECPDCGRGIERVSQFEVHHIDGDTRNGRPSNLVALCKRCHNWRHGSPTMETLDVEEWKEEFENWDAGGCGLLDS